MNETMFKEQIGSLLAIFDEKQPIQKDGTFSPDAVKSCALEMADFIIEDKDSLAALKDWMESHDFWTSPASTRFHGNVKGGLAAHSLMVAVQALRFAPAFAENFALSKRRHFRSRRKMFLSQASRTIFARAELTPQKAAKQRISTATGSTSPTTKPSPTCEISVTGTNRCFCSSNQCRNFSKNAP